MLESDYRLREAAAERLAPLRVLPQHAGAPDAGMLPCASAVMAAGPGVLPAVERLAPAEKVGEAHGRGRRALRGWGRVGLRGDRDRDGLWGDRLMPSWLTDAVVVAAITGLLGVIGGRISSSGAVRAASVQAAAHERELIAAPYLELAERVAVLEREAQELRKRLNTMIDSERRWQAGWDELRRNWPDVRQRVMPPPYPTKNFRGEDG